MTDTQLGFNTPFCRVCGRQNKSTPATWVMDNDAVRLWYLCRKHAEIAGASIVGPLRGMRRLTDDERNYGLSQESTT